MTTPAAEKSYEAQHNYQWEGRPFTVYNPHSKEISDLPFIYGFNNGGCPGWFSACSIAEDGHILGGHTCSSESYMPHDLGLIEGARPDRQETYQKHYPDGYRTYFISYDEAKTHPGIKKAFELNKKSKAEEASNVH